MNTHSEGDGMGGRKGRTGWGGRRGVESAGGGVGKKLGPGVGTGVIAGLGMV